MDLLKLIPIMCPPPSEHAENRLGFASPGLGSMKSFGRHLAPPHDYGLPVGNRNSAFSVIGGVRWPHGDLVLSMGYLQSCLLMELHHHQPTVGGVDGLIIFASYAP